MSWFNIFKPEKKMKPMKLTKWKEMYYAVAPAKNLCTKNIKVVCKDATILWGLEKCVCYLEDNHNPVANMLFSNYYKEIARKFEQVGYTFIYAPKEADEIAKHYAMPIPDVKWSAATMLEMCQCRCDEPIGSVLAVIDASNHDNPSSKILNCTLLEADSQEGIIAILKTLLNILDEDDGNIRFRLSDDERKYESRGEERCMTTGYYGKSDASEEVNRKRKANRECYRKRSILSRVDTLANAFLDEEELTEEDELLLKEIQVRVAKLHQRGVKQQLIEQFVKMTVPISHMEVTSDARILLTDYDKEVPMLPIDKVVYIFYLRHPEGVSIKCLADHKEELMALYTRVLGKKSLTDKQRKSVERLCNPLDNSINEKLSRIRKSFCAVAHESVAEHYVVQGSRGEERSITLDEELIVVDAWVKD